MCSSPRGSSQCFRQTRRKEFSRSEYEEQASMMRRASAVYDRIEQEKIERQQLIARQQTTTVDEDTLCLEHNKKSELQISIFSGIKAFLLQPLF